MTSYPDGECPIPEGAEVEITFEGSTLLAPEVTDPDERSRLLGQIVARMQANPIPIAAPSFSREDLHGRS